MIKKIYFSTFIALFSMTALGGEYTATLNSQVNHIRGEMNSIKRAWNTARLRIKIAQKNNSAAYHMMQTVIAKIVASDALTTKINATVDEQFDAIANRNASFSAVRNDLDAASLLPNLTLNKFGQTLLSVMANKECYLLLGKKLAQKIQELEMTIKNMQQPPSAEYTTTTSNYF